VTGGVYSVPGDCSAAEHKDFELGPAGLQGRNPKNTPRAVLEHVIGSALC